MQKSQLKKTQLYVVTALFIALIFVTTAYLFHIPTPASGGYIHLGDTILYLAASLLPTPFAVAAGGLGEALSDVLTGSAQYAVFTLVIKAAMALCFSSRRERIVTKRNVLAVFLATVICVGGYYLTEVFLLHSFLSPLAEVPFNLIQSGASAVFFVVIGLVFDRLGMKQKFARILDIR